MSEETFRDVLNILGLNDNSIVDYILQSKFQDGSNIFTSDNIYFFYNFCGYIKYHSIDECLEYINYLSTLETWDDKLKHTSPNRTLEDIRKFNMKLMQDKQLPSMRGMIKCRHCGSDNVYQTEKISRADEAAIIGRKCGTCGYRT